MPIKMRHIIFGFVLFLLSPQAMGNNKVLQDSTALSRQKEVFVLASTSKSSVYVGEGFTVTYSLYMATAIIDPQKETNVKFEHCYQQQYPLTSTENEQKIGGRNYRVKILQQYLVIANVEGKLKIPSLKKAIQRNQIDVNNFFGQEKLVTETIISPIEFINVKPLPAINETPSFSHAVGVFSMKGAYHSTNKTPNLLEFSMILDGTGNTKNCIFTPPQANGFWEIYNVATISKDTLEATGLKTRVQFSFQIATNYKGSFTIPAVVFTVFNPSTNAYQKFDSGSYQWKVPHGMEISSKAETELNTIDSKEILEYKTGNLYSYSILFYTLVGLGFLLLLYVYFESYIVRHWKNLQQYRINRQALKIALAACKQQLKALNSISQDAFYQNTSMILLDYINQKKGNDLVLDLVHSNLKKTHADWPIETHNQLLTWWRRTQQYRFGTSKTIHNPKEHYRKTGDSRPTKKDRRDLTDFENEVDED